MDIPLLRTFVTVAECDSFSVAAERLHLTQSTISHQISRLEKELGKKLFMRTTRSCRVTQWGSILLVDARNILRMVQETEEKFNPPEMSGTVKAGIPDDLHLFKPLSDAILLFSEEQPRVAVEITAGLSDDLRLRATSSDTDVVLLRDIPPRTDGESLGAERLLWIAKKGWHRPANSPIPIAFVHGPCSYKRTAIALLDAAGVQWHPIMTCTSLEGVLAAVKAGIAISVVTEGDLREDIVALSPNDGLPDLPLAGLSIQYAQKVPSQAAAALGTILSATIRSLLTASRS